MPETENPKKPEKYIQLVESDFKGSRAKAKRSKPREVVYTLPEPEIRPTRPEGPKATEAIVEQVLRSIVAECSDPDRFSRASLLEKDKYPSECLDLLEEQDRERWPARGVPQSKIVGLVVEGLWQRGFREPWADNGAGWEYIRPMLEKGGFAEYVTGEGAKYKRCNDIIDWDPAWRWVGDRPDPGKSPTPALEWKAPPGYVGTKTICHGDEFRKNGKNPAPSTIQRWVDRASREGNPVKVVPARDTHENHYPREWIMKQLERWNPRRETTSR